MSMQHQAAPASSRAMSMPLPSAQKGPVRGNFISSGWYSAYRSLFMM